jgi:hypothetical protein
MNKDITDQVEFYNNDDESLPLTKCACGKVFDAWDFILSIYDDLPKTCRYCGRKMYFKLEIRVFEVVP